MIASETLEIDFYPGNFGAEFGRFSGGLIDVRLKRPREDRWAGRVEADVFDAGFFVEGPVDGNPIGWCSTKLYRYAAARRRR